MSAALDLYNKLLTNLESAYTVGSVAFDFEYSFLCYPRVSLPKSTRNPLVATRASLNLWMKDAESRLISWSSPRKLAHFIDVSNMDEVSSLCFTTKFGTWAC